MTAQDLKPRGSAEPKRFAFGDNWLRFLTTLDDERIAEARRSLQEMLEVKSLEGLTILDIGSGSGLFSLAAVQLGAARVVSFDFDPASVACGLELRRRYAPGADWTVEQGSALDHDYVRSLGTFDVVYSWGVLHHTGDMWAALENALTPVAPGGRLFVAIYNDQGRKSVRWRGVKRLYNILPHWARVPFVIAVMSPFELRSAIGTIVRLRPQAYVRSWTRYKRSRGMSRWHDMVDWCGGYPYEVAKPEEVVAFCRKRAFLLEKMTTAGGGLGCNQFVLRRDQ